MVLNIFTSERTCGVRELLISISFKILFVLVMAVGFFYLLMKNSDY